MQKNKIPNEWDLGAHRRYKRQNMERAMRGKIERGLVELITNTDDSYRSLEEERIQVSGKILIEIRRKKGSPTIVRVRDRAEGMSRFEMYNKLGELGKRTSGFEKGKLRRGLHGRGARDVAAFGTVHFESIKDGYYNHLIIPPSLKCKFENTRQKKVNDDIRKKLGIMRGNGTVVTIHVEGRFKVPLHERLIKEFSRYYPLRDIFSNTNREVILLDLNKKRKDKLFYKYPTGEIVLESDFTIPHYSQAKFHFILRKHSSPFEQESSLYREGILVKSNVTIHDCTYFGLASEPSVWRFTGEVTCEYIDDLVREYDDREESDPDYPAHPKYNPQRLLDPFREGLFIEHPFSRALYDKCKEILRPFIEELKTAEESSKRNVTNKKLESKLNSLSKKISKVFERKLKELEDRIPPGTIDKGAIDNLSIGLHIIPPNEQTIIVNIPKTFSIIVKHYEALNKSLPISIISSDPEDVKISPPYVFLKKLSDYGRIGKSTFKVESSKIGAEAYIEARSNGYDASVLVKVIDQPPPLELPEGLSFEKLKYHLQINKPKKIAIWLKTSDRIEIPLRAQIISHYTEIIVKGGGSCRFLGTDIPGVYSGHCTIEGRQLKAKTRITAHIKGFAIAETSVVVEERKPPSSIKLKFKPVEEDFGSVRYKWDIDDPYLLLVGAKHPSIRKYLGEPSEEKYPGINFPVYHTILAEVISEALAFRILEKEFKKEGDDGMLDYESTDLYYHKEFSEFLTIAHTFLVTESVSELK
ncbi:MAG: hypothetical protein IIA61_00850 [Candidatus Marinimicrobia bacterium]|nr:hypothetical protein [Candidatus Neomarinimicrobiota bacterium]